MNRILLALAGLLVAFGIFFQWKITEDLRQFSEAQIQHQQALQQYRERNLYYTPWRTIQWIVNRQNPAGYFVTNPDMLFEPSQLNESTLRLTRYAVTILKDLGGLDKINRKALGQFILGLYQPNVERAGAGKNRFAGFGVLPGREVGVRPTMDALLTLDALGLLGNAGLDLERIRDFILFHQNPDGGFWDEHYASLGTRSSLRCTSFAARALAVLEPHLGHSLPEKMVEGVADFVRSTFDPASGGFASQPGERAWDAYDAFRAFISIYDTASGVSSSRRAAVNAVIDMEQLVGYLDREHYLKEVGAYSRYRDEERRKPSIKATHLVIWMLKEMRLMDRVDGHDIARYVASLESANGQYGGDIYTTYSAIGLFQKLGIPTESMPVPQKPVMEEAVPGYVPMVFFLAALMTLVLAHQVKKAELEHINSALSRQASRDGFTGIYNRQKFESELKQALEDHRQHSHPVSIIMFDVDNFKGINDRHGHLAGDQVLREVTELIWSALRKEDVFARWGGEEFSILLSGADEAGALCVAEKLRQLLEAGLFSIDQTVTASFGVAEARPGDDEASLTDRADMAMIQAKKEGRNRVVGASRPGGKILAVSIKPREA
jgi:diguanylate cyclase (GGDEF)-like protein